MISPSPILKYGSPVNHGYPLVICYITMVHISPFIVAFPMKHGGSFHIFCFFHGKTTIFHGKPPFFMGNVTINPPFERWPKSSRTTRTSTGSPLDLASLLQLHLCFTSEFLPQWGGRGCVRPTWLGPGKDLA